jgi:DNA-binding transcriptional regulator YiaG
MANIASILKEEVSRLARKEIRGQTAALRRASARYRKDIADMKRQVAELQRTVTRLEEQVRGGVASEATDADAAGARFTAKGLRSQRKRLGLSAADYGKLVGVTGQTVYSWERQTSRPRKQQVATLASLRTLGKREARARLEQMRRGVRKNPK